jgi:hypothetical protein
MRQTLMAGLIMIGALWGVSVSDAQMLYRWTDDAGQVHVTDDPNSIPPDKRGSVPGMRAPKPSPPPAASATPWQQRAEMTSTSSWMTAIATCKQTSGVEAYSPAVGDVRYFGTNQQRFAFEKCMAAADQPVTPARLR